MGFFGELSDAADELLEELDQTASYTPKGGQATTVRVAWQRNDAMEAENEIGRENRTRGVVQVHEDDAPSPDTRDAFEIDGQTWAVERIEAVRPLAVFHVFAIDPRRFGGADGFGKG